MIEIIIVDIICEFQVVYWVEFEMVMNYIVNLINFDGVCVEEIKKVFVVDVVEEFNYVQMFVKCIKMIGGKVLGSEVFVVVQLFF